MRFNFNLFLYDSLRLPAGLFAEDQAGEVVFEDLQTCRDYCSRYVQSREEWCSTQRQESDHSQERRNELSKEDMFLTTGEALDGSLRCGNEAFDRNLNLVRLDLFGNVMILNAPHWSDVSAQFTHGFPRRLIMNAHRGILPGNIMVAARISNQGIRSVSPGNLKTFFNNFFFLKKNTNKQTNKQTKTVVVVFHCEVKMITLLAPKKIQAWDSFGRLFLDSSVIHLTYYILCSQCSSSDYLWYKVICSCEGLVLRTCN